MPKSSKGCGVSRFAVHFAEADVTSPYLQIETMKQQLESKAVEAVNLLDELDQSNEVPEQLQRIRGQDNFQQRKFF